MVVGPVFLDIAALLTSSRYRRVSDAVATQLSESKDWVRYIHEERQWRLKALRIDVCGRTESDQIIRQGRHAIMDIDRVLEAVSPTAMLGDSPR